MFSATDHNRDTFWKTMAGKGGKSSSDSETEHGVSQDSAEGLVAAGDHPISSKGLPRPGPLLQGLRPDGSPRHAHLTTKNQRPRKRRRSTASVESELAYIMSNEGLIRKDDEEGSVFEDGNDSD